MSYFFSLSEEKKAEVVKRFWSKVDKNGPNGCWVWTDKLNKDGYGRLCIMKSSTEWKSPKVHRLSYLIHYNIDIPSTLAVAHSCDNPPCIRPDHLFLGPNALNLKDGALKDRFSLIKLKDRLKMAQEALDGVSFKKLAEKYNIKHAASVYYYIHHPSVEAIYGKIDLSHRIPAEMYASLQNKG